ncbi:MAG: type I phosphomannose isomerase catalytic subunit [Clostridiales bacterium]|nr:cupin domain-containing protein [Clostridiales bacterium]MDU3240401.1 type I phosphomannose isomerase catalytic subunit [Clostridiales bacterium]
MKCIVLAGGKGNSLWPLSRENYPKQFMQIKENRSIFQETIARNMPFCEEYIIVTNYNHHFIVEGQMKAFQGLKYRCIFEEEGRKTAPAIAIACFCSNPSDLVYVVSSDHIIEGSTYKDTIIAAEKLARKGALVTFGLKAVSPHTGYGYIRYSGEKVCSFHEKPDYLTAVNYINSGDYYWNSGNFLFVAGDFLHELLLEAPQIYEACHKLILKKSLSKKEIILSYEEMRSIPAVSVENAVFERSKNVKVVKSDYYWQDISDIAVLASYMSAKNEERIIEEDCKDVMVINHTDKKLVVVNNLEDTIVVNTDDVTYVTSKYKTDHIKEIIKKNQKIYNNYFENNTVIYNAWGTVEILNQTEHYKVKKVTLFPGKATTYHRHEHRSEQWSVVEGVATITLDKSTKDYHINENVFFPSGTPHMLSNNTSDNVVIIEVATGKLMADKDMEYISEGTAQSVVKEAIVKCEPTFKDYLWGGRKLRDVYGKNCEYDIIAESWELSSHGDGQSSIAEGKYKGMLFDEYLKVIGSEALGWKCKAFERFPILIKLIDAKQQLSIQVHPDDSYALREEYEYGKNEMWYIMDCEEGAFIYFGVNKNVSKQELKKRIENNTVLEILNKVEVKKGDTFFVNAGTIHAIGAGILLCEIQQNSNCTYRLYDYGRTDKYGRLRELHIDKALEVSTLDYDCNLQKMDYQIINGMGYQEQQLGQCKYFVSIKYLVDKSVVFQVDDTSFVTVVIIKGNGEILTQGITLKFKAGDTFFIHAGKKSVCVEGKCEFILTHV